MMNFYLYPYIKLVEGFKRSIVLNLSNGKIYQPTQIQIEIIKNGVKQKDINSSMSYNIQSIEESIQNLQVNGFGKIIYSNIPNEQRVSMAFPAIEICEICLSKSNIEEFDFIFEKLINSGVRTFFFIINDYTDLTNKEIIDFLSSVSFSFNTLIYTKENKRHSNDFYYKICQISNLFRVYLKYAEYHSDQNQKLIKLFEQWKFQVTKEIYYKSLEFHPYFHGRIYIEQNGNISNSYNDEQSVGNILDLSINNVLHFMKKDKFWHINRDKIENCKRCEFRYCCIDNTPIVKSNNEYFLQKSCNYEPES